MSDSQKQKIPLLKTEMVPKPFLRWAGGKRRLADLIMMSIPKSFQDSNGKYFEPFVGGGAVMFALGNPTSLTYITGGRIRINDSNPDLIAAYKTLKTDVEGLINKLNSLSKDTSREAFEKIRAQAPADRLGQAARFIYLNKTCFNGLWRVNSEGKFNVPWGKLKNPMILDENTLIACHTRLQKSRITCGSFTDAVRDATKGDIVYFDPPYLPISDSSNFSKYSKNDFGYDDHIALASTIKSLSKKGVRVILSNSDTRLSREIFSRYLELRQVPMNRSISASASSRKPVMELLGVNFTVPKSSPLTRLKSIN